MSKGEKNKMVPKLRFPEFRDAEPWEEKTLSQVASYENGKAHEQDIVETGNFVVVNSKFVSSDGEEKKFTNTAYSLAQQGDILMVLSDVPNGRAIAKCFFVNTNNLYTVNQRICRITPFDASGLLLFYILNRNSYFLAFDDGVKQTNLRKEDVLNCPTLLPKDKREQQKIADCLSSLDELINAESQKLEALQAHKKGLMQQLFPAEGDASTGSAVPKLRFKEFEGSGEWVEKKLGEIGNFIGGGTPDTTKPQYWDGEIQWFTPTEVKDRNLEKSKRTITVEGLKNSSAKLLPTGALLITTRATIGDVGIASNECTTNQGFQSLIVNSNEVNTFWYYWLIQNKSELVKKASGSTFPEIGKNEIIKIKALRPNKKEQQKIADCLSSMDELITAQTEKIEELKRHKKGLMQAMFP
jgi:type I restriction enzyme S subunit